jgi:predicted transposase YdaD
MEPGEMSRALLKIRCLQRIAAATLDDYHRGLLVNCVKTYPALTAKEQEEYDALLAREEYKAVNNLEITWADQLIAQGREQGEAWGLEVGREQGKQDTLLRLLYVKFGDLPDDVPKQVQEISSVEELDGLLVRLLTANSLADLGLDGHRE